jgi:hypothetical protein
MIAGLRGNLEKNKMCVLKDRERLTHLFARAVA